MPPRLRICPQCHHLLKHQHSPHRSLATAASAITPAAPLHQTTTSPPPIARYPRTQPPSHKPPEFRKSQLHRQYTSLLLSTPLLLLFQHNNLKATEWMAVRRELKAALEKVDAELSTTALAPAIKLEAIQAGIFESAFLVAEYYDPTQHRSASSRPPYHPTDPSTPSSANRITTTTPNNNNNAAADPTLTHHLSRTAHSAVSRHKKHHPLRPLLSGGPLAILSFPLVTPPHLLAALRILSPKAPRFPAPTRRACPGYHDPSVQQGVQKLMLLGARVEGRVFDNEGARWVGGMEGGVDGLRGMLVGVLEEVGGRGLVGALEGVGRSLWVTVEGRRGMLEKEEEEKGRSGGE